MRPISQADPRAVIDIHRVAHVAGRLNVPTLDDVVRRARDESADDFVAFDAGGNAVGILLANATHDWLYEMSRIVAAREGEGIGSFLMRWGLHRAFDERCVHRVFLEVHERNVRARRLYERFGFRQEGVYRDGFCNPEDGSFENLCPYGMLDRDYRTSIARAPV